MPSRGELEDMLSEISQSQKEKGPHLHEFLEEAKSW